MEKIEKSLVVLMILTLGILIGAIITINSSEMPMGIFQYNEQRIPQDRISEKDIIIYPNQIVITLENPTLSKYANTNSMLPIIDEGANGIRIVPKDKNDINVGDIITFEKRNSLIVHRVIEIGNDEQGTYFITKGDNNVFDDGKIRFEQIRYITIGVLY